MAMNGYKATKYVFGVRWLSDGVSQRCDLINFDACCVVLHFVGLVGANQELAVRRRSNVHYAHLAFHHHGHHQAGD